MNENKETKQFQKEIYTSLVEGEVEILAFSSVKVEYQSLKLFVCGGISSSIAKTVSAPFSRLATLQQTQEFQFLKTKTLKRNYFSNVQLALDILKKESWKGFFKGNLIDVIRSFAYGGINFYFYESLKKIFIPYDKTKNGTPSRLLAGGISGVSSLFLIYPAMVVGTKLQVQRNDNVEYKGIIDCFKRVYKEEGIGSFYRGSRLSMIQAFPAMSLNLMGYDFLRKRFEENGCKGLIYNLISGGVSGIISCTSLYPMDVIIKNLHLDGQGKVFSSSLDCVKKVYQNQGIKGFWRGYLPMILRSLPVITIRFALYDHLLGIFGIKMV